MLFLFINIGIIIFVSFILKKIAIIFIPIYLRCCKIPKRYSSNSSDYVNIVKTTSTQQKMLENDRMETGSTEVTSILWRNNTKKPTWKTRPYFVDFKIESTSKFPRRIDVIISMWIRLSKLMKFWQTFHLEFWRQIDGESTKMCPLGSTKMFV